MDWFKIYQDGILRGSLSNADDTTQLIWLKLLAMQNETRLRDGWLHYAPGRPMTREYIATNCHVRLADLECAIADFLEDFDSGGHARIEIAPDGDIFIKNWEKYQAKPDKVIAKEVAIEQGKETNRRNRDTLEALTREVNMLNKTQLAIGKKLRYVLTDDETEILDTETGQLYKKGSE